jgi:hypothetical protein
MSKNISSITQEITGDYHIHLTLHRFYNTKRSQEFLSFRHIEFFVKKAALTIV